MTNQPFIFGFLYEVSKYYAIKEAKSIYYNPRKRKRYINVEKNALRYCELHGGSQEIFAVVRQEESGKYRGYAALFYIEKVARVGYDAIGRKFVDLTDFGASLPDTHETGSK